MSVSVTTTRPINLGQLATELGGARLSAKAEGGTTTVTAWDATTQAALQATIDNHVAIDEAANAQTLRDQALAAMQNNRDDITGNDTYLAIATPTNAQVAAQVRALTTQSTRQARELNGIARLVLGKLDATT